MLHSWYFKRSYMFTPTYSIFYMQQFCMTYYVNTNVIDTLHNDVIMSAKASQITSLTIVYSTVYSRRRSEKHQSSTSLAFVRGIHRWPVNSPHKGPVTRKVYPFDDVIMHPCSYCKDKTNIPYDPMCSQHGVCGLFSGPVSISEKTSFRKISWSLEATRWVL